jgi:hypothetical protein
MKWNKPKPQIGEQRERRPFAWLPTTLDDGYRVWLETYGVREEWRNTKNLPAWCPIRTYALFAVLH